MKKIIALLLLCCLCSCPVHAKSKIEKCSALVEKAQSGYDLKTAIEAVECNLSIPRPDLSIEEKTQLQNSMRENLVMLCAQRYEVTKNTTYLSKIYKYSFDAIDNGTKNVNTVKMAIMTAAIDLNKDNMIKAYDYLCYIDPKAAEEYKDEYVKILDNVTAVIAQNKQIQRLYWSNALFSVGQQFSNNAQQTPQNYMITPWGNSLHVQQVNY